MGEGEREMGEGQRKREMGEGEREDGGKRNGAGEGDGGGGETLKERAAVGWGVGAETIDGFNALSDA